MGCSRPGALAVTCAFAAGFVSMLSLLLPYWSKLKVEAATPNHVEVTFGLWGSCLNLEPTNPATLDSPVVTNGSEVVAIAPETGASETLVCGSYFDEERIRITCTSFRQLASGQCTRRDIVADDTLCDAETAAAFLGDDVHPTIVAYWLLFMEKACGTLGRASIAFAVLSSTFAGLASILILFGITWAAIDSCICKIGAVCTASAALFQFIIGTIWVIETRVIRSEQAFLGTSFYFNTISILLHSIAFIAVKKHQRLEKEAHIESGGDVDEVKVTTKGEIAGSCTNDGCIAEAL